MKPTRDTLNSLVDWDCAFRIYPDGSMLDDGTYPPEVLEDEVETPWELMRGYTGQDSYNGPCMHSSEQLSGRMAQDILDNPGVYVVTVNYSYPDQEDEDQDLQVAGWSVARILD